MAKKAIKTTTKLATKLPAKVPTKASAKAPTKAVTTRKAAPALAPSDTTLMGLPRQTWIGSLRHAKGNETRSGARGFIIVMDTKDAKKTRAMLSPHLSRWQLEMIVSSDQEFSFFQGTQGPVCVLRITPPKRPNFDVADATLAKSPYAKGRDYGASILQSLMPFKLDRIILEMDSITHDQRQGLLIGLEIASYSYQENRGNPRKPRKKLPALLSRSSSEELSPREIRSCSQVALATNLARHLVNLPPADLNPRTYAELIESMFEGSDTTTVEVWSGKKLDDERMNLLKAVGAAASEGPRFVHIRYRPKTPALASQKPIAFVGKGITFDSGGLDIKPSSAMRWMKKDMGGSAACVAIAQWAEATELELPLDIYVALAENAIASSSFRPGDIITSRQGLTIEIHNTDAEGRLVLADALDVAVNAAEKPACVIDLATLTGAIKVGLGGEIAGLFCNDDRLADDILDAGSYRGDIAWRMPLFQPYKQLLRSTFADYANSSDGFAGAITAALFLELFTGDVPWAHLDIYSWKDGAGGAYSETGGNGQPVQMLTELLTRFAQSVDGYDGQGPHEQDSAD